MNNQQMYQNNYANGNMGQPAQVPQMYNGYGYPTYGNNGYPNYGGFAYTAPRPQALNSQPLTQDIVNTLRQDGNEFNMKVDQREIWRAICTHKDPTSGQSTLIHNDDDTYTCSICGETFNFFDGDVADIEKAVKTIVDMMQTCKTIYLDAPNNLTEMYYQQIPLLRRFASLWKHATNNFAKYENYANPLAPVSGNYVGFNAINQLLNYPYGYNYSQPFYGNQPSMGMNPQMVPQYGYGQPVQQQMPAQQPQQINGYTNNFGVDQTGNPLGFNAPVPGVMPTAPQPTAAPAPAAPVAQGNEIQQQKVYNV